MATRLLTRTGISALALALGGPALAERWDLWQFDAPPGEPVQRPEVRAWQLVQGQAFCQFALYVAAQGGPDPRADFAADWDELSRARGTQGEAPVPAASPGPNGWTRLEGTREVLSASAGRYRVRQLTFSGHGLRMTALVNGNDPRLCGEPGERFIAALQPQSPRDDGQPGTGAAPAVPSTAVPTVPAADAGNPQRPPALSAQAWMKTAASYSHWGSNFSLGELAKLSGGQGYARRSWQFGADGRYRYRVEIWSMSHKPRELSGIEDHGRWRMEGDRVIVEPERAFSYVEDRATRTRLLEQPAKTAPTVYIGRLHWLSGMGAWYLVLAPQDGRPTLREGDFDQQPGFPNAYFYGPPPKVGG